MSSSSTTHASRSLAKNFASTAVGNAAFAGAQWLVLIVLAKLGTMTMVGVYAAATALVLPVVAVATLQLRNVFVADVQAQHPFTDYLRLRLATCAAAMVCIIAIAVAGSLSREARLTVVFVGVAKCVEAVTDMLYARWHRAESLHLVSRGLLLNSALLVAIPLGATWAWRRVDVTAAAAALSSAIALAAVAWSQRGREPVAEVSGSVAGMVRLAAYAWPFGVIVGLVSLQASVPRLMVQQWMGFAPLALLAAVTQLTTAGANVVSALAAAASPRLARMLAAGEIDDFRGLAAKLAAIGLAMGVAGALLSLVAGRWILAILYRPEYAPGWTYLVGLSLGAGFAYAASFLGCAMTVARLVRPQLWLFVSAVAIVSVTGALAIPLFGLWGAVLAAALAAVIQAVASVVILDGGLRRARVSRGAGSEQVA